MKIFISNNGVAHNTDMYVTESVRHFNNAITTASNLSCPSSFTYYNYINGLTEKIKTFKDELNRINNALKKSDRRYNETLEKGEDNCKKIKVVDIVEKIPATHLESIID